MDIKEKVLKSDSLIRKLQYDVEHSNTLLSKSEIEKNAHNFLKICTNIEENYLEIYQNKYNLISENKKINVIKLKIVQVK